uniref:Fatty acid synthase n=1 Tax=Panagrolaimus superbus TaxID=310955 RepID=A0A914YN25_9BILA
MGSEYAKADGTEPPNALQIVGEANSVLAGRLNFFFGSHGPSESIDTACSSSMVALQNAVDSIKLGRCKRAIVAGTSLILSSNELAQRISGNLLSKDGICHSFDVDADGYGRAEGIVAILIEAENDAEIPRYLAKIDSIITNHGGRSAALTAPNGMAHFMLLEKAIAESGHLQVDYWECHGTGTSLGDPIEISALQKVFTKFNFGKKVLIGTSKANLGHCEGAAGVAGILKAIIVLQQQYTTSLPRFRLLNKNIKTDDNSFGIPIIGEELTSFQKFVAGVSSFGVSGTNVAAILSSPNTKIIQEKETEVLKVLEKQGIAILPFSAKSQTSLDSLIEAYSILCFNASNKDFSLLSAAAALSRKHFKLKSVFIRTRTGEISQITAATAAGICFKVDCLPSVAWELIFRIPGYKKAFLEKFKTLIDPARKNRKTQIIRSLKISDIWAKWNFLHSLGINFDYIVADSEEEIYFVEEILQLFPTDATIISSELVRGGSIVFGSSAYQIQDSTHLNYIIAAAFLQGQEINWAKVFSLSEFQRNLLPFHELPNYKFDRQIYWSKKICDDFDHKILGNIIFDSETEIRLENWILEQRLKDLFAKIEINEKTENKEILEISLILELLITVAKAILKNIGFEIREFEVIFPLDLSALQENVWFKTVIEFSESENSLNVSTKISSYSSKNKEDTVFFKFKFMLIPNKQIPEDEPKMPQLFQDWTLNFDEIFEVVEASQQLKATNIKFIRVLKGKKGDDNENAQSLTPNLSEGRFLLDMKNEWQLEIVYQKNVIPDKVNPLLQIPLSHHHVKPKKKILSRPNNYSTTLENVQIKLIKALKEAMDSEIILEESELISRGFIDLGLDSLSMMALLNELNLKYFKNIELTTTDLFTYTNVQSLSEIIYQRLNSEHQNDAIEKEEESSSDAESSQMNEEESTAENTSASDSTPPNSPNIDFFNPSPKNAYEIISFVPEIPDSSRIIIHFNDQTSLAEAHFDSTVIQLSSPSSFTALLEKLRLITYSEYSFVFRFDPLPPRPSLIQPETIQFLLTFASTLAKLRRKLYFTVIENENPLSGFFSGFWKSFVVEKMNISRFNFAEKIRPFCSNNFGEMAGIDTIPYGNWLITGGTNGIGLVMAKHLASFPTVSQVYVLSRKGILPKSYHKIKSMKVDVTRFDQIQNLFCTLDSIDGVIHSAGAINDAIIERQTLQSFEKVISPKVDGLKNIIKSLKYFEFKPKYLILNSSVSSLLGNFGQTNYSSANAAAEKLLIAYRKSTGIGSIIHWGNWTETGMGEFLKTK